MVFFFLLYIAAQFSGSGKVLQGTFGLDPFWGVLIASVVVTIYCGLGGFIAVVVTDVFQALLMIFTLVAFPIIALFIAASHDISIAGALHGVGPNYLSLTRGMTGAPAVILILSGLSWALGYTGQPQLLTRMMAIRNRNEVRRAVGVATVWTLLAYTGAILIGLFGVAFVKSGLLGAGASAVADRCREDPARHGRRPREPDPRRGPAVGGHLRDDVDRLVGGDGLLGLLHRGHLREPAEEGHVPEGDALPEPGASRSRWARWPSSWP